MSDIEERGSREGLRQLPKDFFGPIPGIPVGTSWERRVQVSKSGVHRPPMAGIHGREDDGAYSIVLSGAYEDDIDHGDSFFYSGCGGRMNDHRTRLSPQVFDQKLKRQNRALAKNCYAPIDEDNGADASNGDWRKGKPIRVVRKYTLRKFSTYAPEKGYRYDGIYKVVRYRPIMNRSTGLRVWMYEMRRDDESPAPWTCEGVKRLEALNLKMIPHRVENCIRGSRIEMKDKWERIRDGMKIILRKKLVLSIKFQEGSNSEKNFKEKTKESVDLRTNHENSQRKAKLLRNATWSRKLVDESFESCSIGSSVFEVEHSGTVKEELSDDDIKPYALADSASEVNVPRIAEFEEERSTYIAASPVHNDNNSEEVLAFIQPSTYEYKIEVDEPDVKFDREALNSMISVNCSMEED